MEQLSEINLCFVLLEFSDPKLLCYRPPHTPRTFPAGSGWSMEGFSTVPFNRSSTVQLLSNREGYIQIEIQQVPAPTAEYRSTCTQLNRIAGFGQTNLVHFAHTKNTLHPEGEPHLTLINYSDNIKAGRQSKKRNNEKLDNEKIGPQKEQ